MKIILHTRHAVHDDKGGFTVHEPGEQLDLPKAEAEALIARNAAAPAPAEPAKPAKPAA